MGVFEDIMNWLDSIINPKTDKEPDPGTYRPPKPESTTQHMRESDLSNERKSADSGGWL